LSASSSFFGSSLPPPSPPLSSLLLSFPASLPFCALLPPSDLSVCSALSVFSVVSASPDLEDLVAFSEGRMLKAMGFVICEHVQTSKWCVCLCLCVCVYVLCVCV
jgi:hypothetical protein